MKTEQESEVLFQIPLCSLHFSYGFSRCKNYKKRGDKKKEMEKNTHPLCPFLSLKPPAKGLQLIPKSFRYRVYYLSPHGDLYPC